MFQRVPDHNKVEDNNKRRFRKRSGEFPKLQEKKTRRTRIKTEIQKEMDPPKPPKLTRPTMRKSSVELQSEITENLHFLQRQVEVHYGHRATFRSDATVQFLAKIVGLTRQLREQWTRYVELDSTIHDEFPTKLPKRPQTEEEKDKGRNRNDTTAQEQVRQERGLVNDGRPQQSKRTDNKMSTKTGTKPKEKTEEKCTAPGGDHTEDSRKPRQKSMWAQRTTTTIFDGGRKPQKQNRHAQQLSASYIQEQPPRMNKPPTIVYDGSCDKIVNGRQCKFRPYYDCPKHYPALSIALKKANGQLVNDKDEQNYYGKYVDEDGNQLPYGQINAVYKFPPGAGVDYFDDWGMPRITNPHDLPLLWIYIKANPSDKQTKVSQALGLADSGCAKDICGVNYAAKCGLRVVTTDKAILYNASGQPMTCMGSARATISYFNVVAHIKIYVVRDISNEYIMLSKRTCQRIQVLPKEFPQPLQNMHFDYLQRPWRSLQPFEQERPRKKKDQRRQRRQPPMRREQYGFDVWNRQHENYIDREQHINQFWDDYINGDQPNTRGWNVNQVSDFNPKNDQIEVKASFNNVNEKSQAITRLNKLVQQYSRVFNIIIKKEIQVSKVRLRFKKDVRVRPYKCTSSKPIPYALRKAAQREINEQIRLGIIARVPPNVDLEWCSRAMILEKPNGGRDVRLVVDAQELNEFLDRDAYPMQSPKELVRQVPPEAKFFLSVDFYKGYYQIPLAEEDQLKTTFMLHGMGLYYFKKLPQGGKCSVDQFNRITDDLILNVPNCLKLIDDVLLYGETIDELMDAFERLLRICDEKDVTLHPKKLAVGNRIRFAGYMVSNEGVTIDPKKVEAIRLFKTPQNVTDMKAFIGVAVQFQDACPGLMGALKPLIETTSYKVTPAKDDKGKKITNPKRKIIWNANLETAFHEVKKLLTNADGTVLSPYDPTKQLQIYTDASRLNGYGWIAVQETNGIRKLIECGSCTISDSNRRNYSVSELELAAVEMALRKMRLMTVGNNNLVIKTDHLPLIGIMKKPLEKIETKRLMKLAEKLQDYTFKLEYIQGARNEVADALSRNPVTSDQDEGGQIDNKLMVNLVSEFTGRNYCSMYALKKLAAGEKDYQLIKSAIQENVAVTAIPPQHPARMYKSDWNLLAINDDLITLGDRILVPKNARKDILNGLHTSHLGRNKTIALARTLYYWKNMAKDIEQLVEQCEKCQQHARFQQKETLKQTFAKGPMHMNSADLAQYAGKDYLVHADRYSNFLWIYRMKDTSSNSVTNALWSTFYQMGFPNYLRTDNGPQFVSRQFIEKCTDNNIELEVSDPYYPVSNGHAEKMVGVAKSLIKKAENMEELRRMLQVYNSTPSVTTGVSPAEMLMGRKIRTNLPMVERPGFIPMETIRRAERRKSNKDVQTKMHYDKSARNLSKLEVGTRVRIYNHKTSRWDMKGTIVMRDAKTDRSYRILTTNDVFIFRNRRYIKPISQFDHVPNR